MRIIQQNLRNFANVEEFGPRLPLTQMPRTARTLLKELPPVMQRDIDLRALMPRDQYAQVLDVADIILYKENWSADLLRLMRAWAKRNLLATREIPLPARMPNERQAVYRQNLWYALEWIIDAVNYRVDGVPLPREADGTVQEERDDAQQEQDEEEASKYDEWIRTTRDPNYAEQQRKARERKAREVQQRIRDALKHRHIRTGVL